MAGDALWINIVIRTAICNRLDRWQTKTVCESYGLTSQCERKGNNKSGDQKPQ